jgi:16S rRNA (guanine966-N2)-methyltransferase
MRIITGKLKGRKLTVPDNVELRPTSDRAKEGMFNVIQARRYLDGCTVLDLFAGTGNLGFEAISRGAASVLMVDISPIAIKQIERTAEKFGVKSQVMTRISSVDDFIKKPVGSFDIIFCDPPYDHPLIPDSVEIILNEGWLKPDGWYILEHDVRHLFHEHPKCVFTKPYGRTIVSVFMNETPGES